MESIILLLYNFKKEGIFLFLKTYYWTLILQHISAKQLIKVENSASQWISWMQSHQHECTTIHDLCVWFSLIFPHWIPLSSAPGTGIPTILRMPDNGQMMTNDDRCSDIVLPNITFFIYKPRRCHYGFYRRICFRFKQHSDKHSTGAAAFQNGCPHIQMNSFHQLI